MNTCEHSACLIVKEISGSAFKVRGERRLGIARSIESAWETSAGNRMTRRPSVLLETYWFVDLRTALLVLLFQQTREVVDAGGIGVTH